MMKVINKINSFFSRVSYKNIVYYCLCMFILIIIAYLNNLKESNIIDILIYILGGKSTKENSLMNIINVFCFLIIILKNTYEYIYYALNKQYYMVCYRMESKKTFHVKNIKELICLIFMYITIFFFIFIIVGIIFNEKICNYEMYFILQTYLLLFIGLMSIVAISYLFIFLFNSISLALILVIVFICINLIGFYIPIGSFVVINEIISFTFFSKLVYVIINISISFIGFIFLLIIERWK